MIRPELLVLLKGDLSRLDQISKLEGVGRDESALPSEVLSFAESLLVCPTEYGARLQMRRDLKGATGFLSIAYSLETELPKIGTSISGEIPKNTTPFYIVSALVQEYLGNLKRDCPNDWK